MYFEEKKTKMLEGFPGFSKSRTKLKTKKNLMIRVNEKANENDQEMPQSQTNSWHGLFFSIGLCHEVLDFMPGCKPNHGL